MFLLGRHIELFDVAWCFADFTVHKVMRHTYHMKLHVFALLKQEVVLYLVMLNSGAKPPTEKSSVKGNLKVNN